mmetsp:Transcript_3510/g.6405  ORF Transcript_3510/g.6405 Transcript_3510/m.6405 type:complete len:281 (-) Transcript_3510:829-1671(-)
MLMLVSRKVSNSSRTASSLACTILTAVLCVSCTSTCTECPSLHCGFGWWPVTLCCCCAPASNSSASDSSSSKCAHRPRSASAALAARSVPARAAATSARSSSSLEATSARSSSLSVAHFSSISASCRAIWSLSALACCSMACASSAATRRLFTSSGALDPDSLCRSSASLRCNSTWARARYSRSSPSTRATSSRSSPICVSALSFSLRNASASAPNLPRSSAADVSAFRCARSARSAFFFNSAIARFTFSRSPSCSCLAASTASCAAFNSFLNRCISASA